MMSAISAAVVLLGFSYWFGVRPAFLRWGASDADLARPMPGDAIVEHPAYQATLAITLNAAPRHVWPWLLQLGYQRGGLYSYDALDRLFGYLDRPSATRILPEFQQLAPGDEIPVGRGGGFPVVAVDPQRTLVLGGRGDGFAWVWQFGLYAVDANHTRLVSKNIVRTPASVGAWLFMRALEPAAFLMTRRMLIGLKQRAEHLAAAENASEVRAA